jgi:transposase
MEGSSLKNGLAAYGHCKSKRFDCPIITLSLLANSNRIPVFSHIYKGNQAEPETMKDMIKRFKTLHWSDPGQLSFIVPSFVMDRGIAAK